MLLSREIKPYLSPFGLSRRTFFLRTRPRAPVSNYQLHESQINVHKSIKSNLVVWKKRRI